MESDNSHKNEKQSKSVIDSIDLVSTSFHTALASPIILNKTELIQIKFEPVLVDNTKNQNMCVNGKLIYEKKRKCDKDFPSEKITRGSIKVGEIMEIALDTNETYNLFVGLNDLYELYENIGTTPLGTNTYSKVSSCLLQLQSILRTDPEALRLIGDQEHLNLVKQLLHIITKTESIDSLKSGLKELEQSSVSALSNAINIEHLERVLVMLEQNIDNDSEEFWQTVFTDNQWILSQIFASPFTIFGGKAYVGGKGIENAGGNLCDFIYQNNLTKNIALIEIKTPCTLMFGNPYRGTYSFSTELSGAINQVIHYKEKLTKEYYGVSHNSSETFEMFNPKCSVIIGKIDSLNQKQIETLENYRNCLNNVEIITFDEVIKRIRNILVLFLKNITKSENSEDDFIFDI